MDRQLQKLCATPAFWGWGLSIAWKALLAPYSADSPFASAVSIIVLVTTSLGWSRIGHRAAGRRMLWIVTLLGAVGTVCLLSSKLGLPIAPAAISVIASFSNLCATLLIALMWSTVFSRIPMAATGLMIGASYLTASAVALAFMTFPSDVQAGASLLLFPASAGCVAFCSLQLNFDKAGGRDTIDCLIKETAIVADPAPLKASAKAYPWRLVLVLAFFAFAVGISRTHSNAALDVSCAGIAGAILVACTIVAIKRINAFLLYKAVIPIMLGCLLVGILSGASTTAAQIAINVSYAFAQMLLVLLLCDKSYRFGSSIIFLYGIGRASLSAALLLGSLTGHALSTWLGAHSFLSTEFIYGIVLFGSFCAIVFWMGTDTSLEPFASADKTPENPDTADEPNGTQEETREVALDGEDDPLRSQLLQDLIATRCEQLSQEYRLSKRESEILVLLAWGKSARRIEEMLVVSANTVKTHVRHIYTKLGIHSRAELDALLDAGVPTSDR